MEYHWSRRRGGPNNAPQNARLPPRGSRKASVEVALFDIERDGDPRILRCMYYDFIVTKNEAYYQLQPGYLPTEKYPRRQKSEPIIIKGERRHACGVPCCAVDPFPRHADLERHFKREHENSRDEYCDYTSCNSSAHTDNGAGDGDGAGAGAGGQKVFRLDKIQDHYRDAHNEDLILQKPSNANSDNANEAARIDKFLAQRVGAGLVSLAWWRCSKCKQRVVVREDDYQCPRCKLLCEPERVAWRRNMSVFEGGEDYGMGEGGMDVDVERMDAFGEDVF